MPDKIKRVCHKSRSFKEAEEWDIRQHIQMTPEERQEAAAELRRRIFGEDVPDVRSVHLRR
jgi:hypothetical protein